MAMKRAAIYVRQSKSDDEGIERQVDRTSALATARDWTIVGSFVDNDVSASKPRGAKTAWGQMLARSDEFDVVVSVDLDRIVRTTRDINTLIDHGLMLVTVDGEIDLTTADGEFRASMLASIARFEVRRKGERQRRASDQRAAKGMPTVHPGFGYRRVDGRDVVDEGEAVVVREAARRVLNGESLRSIAMDFNARGVPSPAGAAWQGVTLRQLIRRPSLAGLRTHRGKVVGEFDADMHPAVLDRDVHERLVALFDDPRRAASSRVGHPPKYLLAGIAVCGLCGETLGGRMKRLPAWTPPPGSKSKPVKAAYACGTCHKVRRLQEPVDKYVEAVMVARLESLDAVDMLAQVDEDALREARDAIDAIDAKLATAADQFADDVITGDQLSRITAKLRAERAKRGEQIRAAVPAALPVELFGPGAREAWERSDIALRRLIVRELVDVTILPSGSGRSFDPELIQVVWREEVGA